MPTLDWIGKNAVISHHETVPFRLLVRDPELSVGDVESNNLLVQGDNLEALKALLPKYAGQVKLIYIDPPYNTGNEGWVYNDNVNSPEIKTWLAKIVGKEAEDLSRHDKWLCMMYPRLKLLKELLHPQHGTIWVSIDDNAVQYMKCVLDEIFGPSAFVASNVWQKRYSRENRGSIGDAHEYILVYATNAESFKKTRNKVSLDEKNAKVYKNPNNDPAGRWRGIPMTAQGYRPNQMYPIITPSGKTVLPPRGRCWSTIESEFKKLLEQKRVYFGKKGNSAPSIIRYLSEVDGLVPWTWWTHEEVGHTDEAKKELTKIFGDVSMFDTPKPTRLIQRILQIATSPSSNDIVLDSFAGSGTTGHAVLKQNASDGGNRQFVLVEIMPKIAEPITKKRLEYAVEQHSGNFTYARLGETLFEAGGRIREGVSYASLAQHVYYSETAETLLEVKDGALLGISVAGVAVYLLYNGVLKDKHAQGGNVLTRDVLHDLPAHDGPRVIYGTANRLSADTMTRLDLTFKQIPYQIRVR